MKTVPALEWLSGWVVGVVQPFGGWFKQSRAAFVDYQKSQTPCNDNNLAMR